MAAGGCARADRIGRGGHVLKVPGPRGGGGCPSCNAATLGPRVFFTCRRGAGEFAKTQRKRAADVGGDKSSCRSSCGSERGCPAVGQAKQQEACPSATKPSSPPFAQEKGGRDVETWRLGRPVGSAEEALRETERWRWIGGKQHSTLKDKKRAGFDECARRQNGASGRRREWRRGGRDSGRNLREILHKLRQASSLGSTY